MRCTKPCWSEEWESNPRTSWQAIRSVSVGGANRNDRTRVLAVLTQDDLASELSSHKDAAIKVGTNLVESGIAGISPTDCASVQIRSLSPEGSPISHQTADRWSSRRVSNSQHPAWKAGTLPIELLLHTRGGQRDRRVRTEGRMKKRHGKIDVHVIFAAIILQHRKWQVNGRFLTLTNRFFQTFCP